MTIAEFERLPDLPDGSKLELVRGEVLSSPPSKARHGLCCLRVGTILGNFVYPARLGWVTSNGVGVVLERDPDTVRGPDVAFWSIARQPEIPDGYFQIPPDLAVEVLSPDDRRIDVRAKIKQYLFHSVRLVWLVDPEARTVTVYRGTMRGDELGDEDTLDAGDVLPGFSCKVADILP
jgi:Uma2 family endonuclease